ncbi:hypothetical protein MBLNU459_g5995t1 [Dothideomycetes sp. NU459]
MAFQHENLMYSMLSLSALHMLRSHPNAMELMAAHQTYLGLALHEQRKAVASLTNGQDADSVCMASTMILIGSFAQLQDRSLEPYSPPMEWLRLGRGVWAVFKTALDSIRPEDEASSLIMTIVKAPPAQLHDHPTNIDPENRRAFVDVLGQDIESRQCAGEIWDAETSEAYQSALSYVGSLVLSLRDREPVYAICRRLMGFSIHVGQEFINLVELQRPRALVILAHYFALAGKVKSVWWLDKTSEREIAAIRRVLPATWQDLMPRLSEIQLPTPEL